MTTWEDDLSIGDPALDTQHRQLILLATRACLKIDSDTRLADADIKHLLLDFAAFVAHHFSCEERLLARLNYPALENHARNHAKFTDSLISCIARIDTHSVTFSELCVLLEDRLIHHILVEDAALRPFLSALPDWMKTGTSDPPRAPCPTHLETPELTWIGTPRSANQGHGERKVASQ